MSPTPPTVHVWTVPLDVAHGPYLASLSPDEKARADRFHFDIHRSRFIVGRGVLRAILGRWLSIAPSDVAFAYGRYGKPVLAGDGSPHFNVSHSHGWALVAVCTDHAVGIDIEAHRPLDRLPELAATVFNERELGQLAGWSGGSAQAAFFRGWARKEAFFKCSGAGLSARLQSVTVDLGERAGILAIDDDDAARWTIRDLDAPADHSAAVVVPAVAMTIERHDLIV